MPTRDAQYTHQQRPQRQFIKRQPASFMHSPAAINIYIHAGRSIKFGSEVCPFVQRKPLAVTRARTPTHPFGAGGKENVGTPRLWLAVRRADHHEKHHRHRDAGVQEKTQDARTLKHTIN